MQLGNSEVIDAAPLWKPSFSGHVCPFGPLRYPLPILRLTALDRYVALCLASHLRHCSITTNDDLSVSLGGTCTLNLLRASVANRRYFLGDSNGPFLIPFGIVSQRLPDYLTPPLISLSAHADLDSSDLLRSIWILINQFSKSKQ